MDSKQQWRRKNLLKKAVIVQWQLGLIALTHLLPGQDKAARRHIHHGFSVRLGKETHCAFTTGSQVEPWRIWPFVVLIRIRTWSVGAYIM